MTIWRMRLQTEAQNVYYSVLFLGKMFTRTSPNITFNIKVYLCLVINKHKYGSRHSNKTVGTIRNIV